MSSLEQLVDKLVVSGVEEEQPRETRKSVRKLSFDQNFQITPEIEEQILDIALVLGKAKITEDLSEMSEEDRYIFMREAKTIQSLQDILEGRYAKLKQMANEYITARNANEDEPDKIGGVLASERLGYGFSKEIRGGKTEVDWMALAEESKLPILNTVTTSVVKHDPDGQKISELTTVTHEVNEQVVERMLGEDKIPLSLLRKFLKKSRVTAAMVIRKLK